MAKKSGRMGEGIGKWIVVPLVAGAMGLGVGIGITTVAGALSPSGQAARTASQSDDDTLRQLTLFADVLARVKEEYVIPVDDKTLIEGSIQGMLQSLDPHSSYMTAEDLTRLDTQIRGEYGGLGLEVTSENGAVKVVTPMDESPGARAGIKAGDLLIAIDGKSVLGLPLDDAVSQMRGPAGTSITVTVVRDGGDPFDVRVTREQIRVRPVNWRMEQNVAYIRVSTFVNENTAQNLNAAIDEIRRDHGATLKGVVLDLRNNGGGQLDQAVQVTDAFAGSGEVVSIRGRQPGDVQRLFGEDGERLPGVPMVVLINEGSASASEIVAGALQDRGRATIVGMNSFGKGSVQTIIRLNDGRDGALRLTTARYYTPAGRSIQGAGIKPDIEISAVRVTDEELNRRLAAFRGEENLPHALDNDTGARRDPPHMPAEMPPEGWDEKKDYQLERAVTLLTQGLPPRGAAQRTAQQPAAPAARTAQAPAAAAQPKGN